LLEVSNPFFLFGTAMKPISFMQKRPTNLDIDASEAILKAAMALVVPDDLSRRKKFERLMPYIYVLRNKGCSWSQLTSLLIEAGLDLQMSTVKSYYFEMLEGKQDLCQQKMNEQLLLLAEIKEQTSRAEYSSIKERVISQMNQQRIETEDKVNAALGFKKINGGLVAVPKVSAPFPQPVDVAPTIIKKSAQDTIDEKSNEVDDVGSFGLLNTKKTAATGNTSAKKPTFLENQSNIGTVRNSDNGVQRAFICCPLHGGVTPLKKRDTVEDSVYSEGLLEHPAIDGLLLTLDQRLYGAYLEYKNTVTGEIITEDGTEKRFRILWQKPIKMASNSDFTKMNVNLFT
jgi:hypothetical protein